MKFSELKQKDVVNILDGRRLGRAIDIEFSPKDGNVESITVPGFVGPSYVASISTSFPWSTAVLDSTTLAAVSAELLALEEPPEQPTNGIPAIAIVASAATIARAQPGRETIPSALSLYLAFSAIMPSLSTHLMPTWTG